MRRRGIKKTVFNHLILSYTVLSILLVGSIGGYGYVQANEVMNREIAKESLSRIDSAQSFIETTLLKKYEDNLQNKALAVRFIQNNSNLNLLLYGGWKGNLSRVASFRSDLEFFRLENEGVMNVSVYFPKQDYMIDAERFYMKTANSPEAGYFASIKQKPFKHWMARNDAEGNRVLSYMIKLPYAAANAEPEGYFLIDVDVRYLQEAIRPMLSTTSDRLLIADGNGEELFAIGSDEASVTAALNEAARSKASGGTTVRDDDGAGIVSKLPAEGSIHGWTYVMYRPLHSVALLTDRLTAGLLSACGIIVLFGMLMSFFFSKKLYVPVQGLLNKARSVRPAPPHSAYVNEYVLIGDTFSFMNEKIVDLEMQARRSERLGLLLGMQPAGDTRAALPESGRYRAVYLRITAGDMQTLQRVRDRYGSISGEWIFLNDREAAILYVFPPDDEPGCAEIIGELRQLMQEVEDQASFRAAVGVLADGESEIAESYRTALQAARYHFVQGEDTIIVYDSLDGLSAEPLLFHYEHYRNALQAGDRSAITTFIADFSESLKRGNLQIETVELAVLQLITQLYQCLLELKLQQLLPEAGLFEELKADTLDQTARRILELSERVAECRNADSNQAHAEVIRTIKAYIEEHLHEDLSLQILSREVSLAPAYISTLFSEGTKSSFTEYVTRLRLEKAADLLIEQPRLSVASIAEQVGYRNAQYFHSKFKARYGVTPVQYRKAKREDGDWIPLNG
ncbi:helix-turn-helix domain-containing protein [Saccharibacillus sp. CPCC 101409]|uniref:helix-turn-helix domain-containing protein n=1 Tax=Saccharibacillus sp. CPCC 101409 TaxID=3058041 RepID=UPI00267363BA|nr:helix-turn-helix domain-containing protein [Saccharibacillus sp. CPCC 101409]MDO3411929.1 helix-turn-helix domain-containing protein [Saccharibacillus sp. CPCC 101409]